MRPLPAPSVPGKTEYERFDNAVRQVLTVSKEELLKRETQEKKRPKKIINGVLKFFMKKDLIDSGMSNLR